MCMREIVLLRGIASLRNTVNAETESLTQNGPHDDSRTSTKVYRKCVVSFKVRNGPATLKVIQFCVLSSSPLQTGEPDRVTSLLWDGHGGHSLKSELLHITQMDWLYIPTLTVKTNVSQVTFSLILLMVPVGQDFPILTPLTRKRRLQGILKVCFLTCR